MPGMERRVRVREKKGTKYRERWVNDGRRSLFVKASPLKSQLNDNFEALQTQGRS